MYVQLASEPKGCSKAFNEPWFDGKLLLWKYHGEQEPTNNIESDVNMHASNSGVCTVCENFGLLKYMVGDALGVNLSYNKGDEEETISNEKALKS